MALAGLLALHGAIHLFGFLKWSKLAAVPQLGGRTLIPLSALAERLFAVGWLIVLLLLLGAAVLRGIRHESWWAVALAGAVLSQALIVVAWPDAKAGTIANLIILVAVVLGAAHARFVHRFEGEARALLRAASPPQAKIVNRTDLEPLPAPVRRWLERSGVLGRPRATTVRLRQRGELRTQADGAWMPARAEQYFSIDPPAFAWRVDATMMRVVPIAGRDTYAGGHGQMLIKAGSLVNVVDVGDAKIDQGALLRYLGEIIWFPSAALATDISWQAIDAARARATLRNGGLTVSAVFTVDQQGRVARFDASRYLGAGPDARLTPWFATCSAWRTFEGVEVPAKGEVGWDLAAGPFIYFRWEIVDRQADRSDLYPRG
jgi:hypothetical protein